MLLSINYKSRVVSFPEEKKSWSSIFSPAQGAKTLHWNKTNEILSASSNPFSVRQHKLKQKLQEKQLILSNNMKVELL